MISDVLHEAVNEIDRYLNDPVFATSYTGELRDHIVKVRDEMHSLRAELDAPPTLDLLPVKPVNPFQSLNDFQLIGRGLREPLTLHERQQAEFARKMAIAQKSEGNDE